jgi:hypothetical protein
LYDVIKEQAYFILARPLVEYASTVWDPYTQADINKVEAVQRRAVACSGAGDSYNPTAPQFTVFLWGS